LTRPSRSPLVRSTFDGLTTQYLGAIIQGVAQLGVLILLARLLTPRDYGLFGLATISVGFAALVAQFGLRVAIVQRPALTERIIRAGFTLALLFGLGMALLLCATAPLLARFFGNPQVTMLIVVLSLSLLFTNLGIVAEALLQREMAWRAIMWAEASSWILGYSRVAAGMGLAGLGVWSLAGSVVCQALLRSSQMIRARPHAMRPLLSGPEFGELARFGWAFTLARFCSNGAQQGDNFVVGKVLGTGPLGFYSRAFKLMQIPMTYFATIVTKVLFPTMARLQHTPEKMKSAYLTGAAVLSLVSAPLSVLLVVTAPELVHVVLGPRWLPAVLPLQILSLGIVARSGYLMGYCLDGAMGTVLRRAARDAIYLASVVGGSLIGTRFGIAGVAAGVLGAILIQYGLAASMGTGVLGYTWGEYIRCQVPGLVVGGLCAIIAVTVRLGLLQLGLPPVLVLGGTALAGSALTVLLIVGRPGLLGEHGRTAFTTLWGLVGPKLPPGVVARIQALARQLGRRGLGLRRVVSGDQITP
jgi:PST family polysaccharide transporter